MTSIFFHEVVEIMWFVILENVEKFIELLFFSEFFSEIVCLLVRIGRKSSRMFMFVLVVVACYWGEG